MTSCTPFRPRSTRWRRNADQPDLSSLAPSQIPRISRNPSELTAEATSSETLRAGPAKLHDDAVHETLTYYGFPDIHWQKIRTNGRPNVSPRCRPPC